MDETSGAYGIDGTPDDNQWEKEKRNHLGEKREEDGKVKWMLKNWGIKNLDSSGAGYNLVVGCCELRNKTSPYV